MRTITSLLLLATLTAATSPLNHPVNPASVLCSDGKTCTPTLHPRTYIYDEKCEVEIAEMPVCCLEYPSAPNCALYVGSGSSGSTDSGDTTGDGTSNASGSSSASGSSTESSTDSSGDPYDSSDGGSGSESGFQRTQTAGARRAKVTGVVGLGILVAVLVGM